MQLIQARKCGREARCRSARRPCRSRRRWRLDRWNRLHDKPQSNRSIQAMPASKQATKAVIKMMTRLSTATCRAPNATPNVTSRPRTQPQAHVHVCTARLPIVASRYAQLKRTSSHYVAVVQHRFDVGRCVSGPLPSVAVVVVQ